MAITEYSDNPFQESCDNGSHIFQFIDNTSKCRNCNITYTEYQEKKQREFLEK